MKHGRCREWSRTKSILLTHNAFVASLKLHGKKRSSNKKVLWCISLTTMHFTLNQRRLCWLSHVLRMYAERIPKSLLYDELVVGKRNRGLQKLLFKEKWRKKKTKRKGKRELYKLKKWESENFLFIFSVCIFIYYLFFCLLHHNYAQPVPTDSGLLWLNYEKFITRVKKRYTIISTLINFYRINSNLGYFRLKSIQIN